MQAQKLEIFQTGSKRIIPLPSEQCVIFEQCKKRKKKEKFNSQDYHEVMITNVILIILDTLETNEMTI